MWGSNAYITEKETTVYRSTPCLFRCLSISSCAMVWCTETFWMHQHYEMFSREVSAVWFYPVHHLKLDTIQYFILSLLLACIILAIDCEGTYLSKSL